MTKKLAIINNPITRNGDFVRIKDNLISVEKNLEKIREHLKEPYKGIIRFQEKIAEQISKERYDKALEEVDFETKLHDWIYDSKNKDKIEIVKRSKFSEHEPKEVNEVLVNYVEKNSKEKWRLRALKNPINGLYDEVLTNEETGQIFFN